MPSASLIRWQNDRLPRLDEVEAHVAALAAGPPNAAFLEESLRGFVLHLSAHFQGFCRDLYSECCQIWIDALPLSCQGIAIEQSAAMLHLEKGNPTLQNLKADFARFGVRLDFPSAHPDAPRWLTDLGHLNAWRNKAAHQGTRPLASGVPANLTVRELIRWKAACDGLSTALNDIMLGVLSRTLGVAPW